METVATPVFEEAQGVVASAVPEPVNVEVRPTHALAVPLIVGNAFTVKLILVSQPFVFL